jgi:hypothetical protein
VTDLDWPARELGLRLGLGDLNRSVPCMGFQNCCKCPECAEREQAPEIVAPVRQPWETAA